MHERRTGAARQAGRTPRSGRHGRFDPLRYSGLIALAIVMALAARQYLAPELGLPGIDTLLGNTTVAAARPFTMCATGRRADCVVDGDTFYFGHEKIRIADIDTPEVFSPSCTAEKALGERATRRLHALLNAGPIALRNTARKHDIFGRRLAVVRRDGRSLGDTLVAEGLAHPWRGRRESWCG